MSELVESSLSHTDHKVTIPADHGGRNTAAAQNHRTVGRSAALFGTVGGHPGNIEVTQSCHIRKHFSQTQNPLTAESAQFHTDLLIENGRFIAKISSNAFCQTAGEESFSHLFRITDHRRCNIGYSRFRIVTDAAQRELFHHLFFDELIDLFRIHLEIDGTGGEYFNKGEPFAFFQVFDSFEHSFFGFLDIGGGGKSHTFNIHRSFQSIDDLGYLHGESVGFHFSSVGTCCCHLSGKSGGSHLTAGHTVVGVIYKEYSDLFTAVGSLDEFIETNSPQVTIPLIGDHIGIRLGTGDPGTDGRRTSVRNGDASAVEIVVGEHSTAYGSNKHGIFLDTVEINGFRNQFMQYSMTAAGAVVHIFLCNTGFAVEGFKKDRTSAEFYFFTHFATSL